MVNNANNLLRYGLAIESTNKHWFQLTLRWHVADAGEVVLAMPAWAPGSYMIRNFARHVVKISATQAGVKCVLRKRDKDSWALQAQTGEVELTYTVYAADTSVRAAYLDGLRGFVNGPAVFIRPLGLEHWACELELAVESLPKGWEAYTTLPMAEGRDRQGVYFAESYHALLDYPIELGVCEVLEFDVAAVPHQIVLSGAYSNFDRQRLMDDVRAICVAHVERFHGQDSPPFQRYIFFLNVTHDGYGGLEHRDSTALVCSVSDLPGLHMEGGAAPKYRQLLGLFSHEYFHVWNVKRITPQCLQLPDYQREVHTELLWSFEGFTSYFDDYTVLQAGGISVSEYLHTLAETVSRVQRGAGRGFQSVAESSFDAWTRFYLQDANSPNAIVSYYAKGAILALCLDLRLRLGTDGQVGLQDVMQALWRSYCETAAGVGEDEIQQVVKACLERQGFGAAAVVTDLDGWVHGVDELPLQSLLAEFGVDMSWRTAYALGDNGGKGVSRKLSVWLGAEVRAEQVGLKLATVHADNAAEKAGLMAGDVLVAVNARKATVLTLEAVMAEAEPEDRAELHFFRDSVLRSVILCWQAPPLDRVVLAPMAEPSESVALRYQQWLGDVGP